MEAELSSGQRGRRGSKHPFWWNLEGTQVTLENLLMKLLLTKPWVLVAPHSPSPPHPNYLTAMFVQAGVHADVIKSPPGVYRMWAHRELQLQTLTTKIHHHTWQFWRNPLRVKNSPSRHGCRSSEAQKQKQDVLTGGSATQPEPRVNLGSSIRISKRLWIELRSLWYERRHPLSSKLHVW